MAALANAYRAFAHRAPRAASVLFTDLGPGTGAPLEVAAEAARPVVEAAAALVGPGDALPAARVLTSFAYGFTSMERAGAFQLGGDVDDAFHLGVDTLVAGFGLRASVPGSRAGTLRYGVSQTRYSVTLIGEPSLADGLEDPQRALLGLGDGVGHGRLERAPAARAAGRHDLLVREDLPPRRGAGPGTCASKTLAMPLICRRVARRRRPRPGGRRRSPAGRRGSPRGPPGRRGRRPRR